MLRRRILALAVTLPISMALVVAARPAVRSIWNPFEPYLRNPFEPHLQRMLDIGVWRGATTRMRLLILLGADVNGKVYSQFVCGNASPEDNARAYHYPLHSAALAGQDKAVELLLNHGADVNAVDGFGRTALWHVALGGHADTARLLISRGANVNPPKGNSVLDKTPLEQAIEGGEQAVIEVLLRNGAKQ